MDIPIVHFVERATGERHKQQLYDLSPDKGGRVDWACVEKAFGGEVETEAFGIPSLLQEGVWKGLTRHGFLPDQEVHVVVRRTGETMLSLNVHGHCVGALGSNQRFKICCSKDPLPYFSHAPMKRSGFNTLEVIRVGKHQRPGG